MKWITRTTQERIPGAVGARWESRTRRGGLIRCVGGPATVCEELLGFGGNDANGLRRRQRIGEANLATVVLEGACVSAVKYQRVSSIAIWR